MYLAFQLSIVLMLSLLLQLIGLVFSILIDPYIYKKDKIILFVDTLLIFSLVIQNIGHYWFSELYKNPRILTGISVYGYLVRPVILALFLKIIHNARSIRPAWFLISINTLIYLSTFFSDFTFSYTEHCTYCRGPLGYTCHIISGILLLQLLSSTMRTFLKTRKTENIIPIVFTMLINVAIFLDFKGFDVFPISFLTIAVVNSCIFYYIWLHLLFVQDHEQSLLADQRIQIMMTQIQPHFLYNTLSTIQVLCKLDPEKAFDTTEKFGTYLRQNLDSLRREELIPFRKELEHTRIYAEIEMLRFSNIHLEYDIKDNDFYIPALTLQPMVENAIRHGVRIRENGKIQIRTYNDGKYHIIEIQDNGIGFDPKNIESLEDTHIGIRNVRERIEKQCNGILSINSIVGEGTTVLIRIPMRHILS